MYIFNIFITWNGFRKPFYDATNSSYFLSFIADMGGDLIWFGILVVVAVEISLITPPVGLNVHVLKTIVKNKMTLKTIFKGVMPFVFMDFIRLIILLIFPFLTLLLPNTIWS